MQLELVLTAATLCVAIVGVISGLFGMNLTNTHEGSYTAFILVRAHPLSLIHACECFKQHKQSTLQHAVTHIVPCTSARFGCNAYLCWQLHMRCLCTHPCPRVGN